MNLFIISIFILAVNSLFLAFLAVFPKLASPHCCNRLGCYGAATASLCGFASTILGLASGSQVELYEFVWGLPEGAYLLSIDNLSRFFLLPVFGLGIVCSLSGRYSLRDTSLEEHNLAAHWFFYNILIFAMVMVCCAADAVFFMIVWEVMSLSPFFLIDFNDGERKVRDAAWVYLVAAHLGAVALIAFFALLWDTTGSTSLHAILASRLLADVSPIVLNFLFILALLGFGAKAGIVPLHVWLPEAHPAAPSHVSALMSGAMINVGLYGVMRSLELLNVSNSLPEWWAWLLLGVGICTGFIGILKALAQSNLKRLLAYSSVENMGLMFIGVGAGLLGQTFGNPWITILGFSAVLIHMVNHAGFKGLLFLCAGEVLHSTGTLHLEHLGGLQKRLPFLGFCFALGAASIACLPPFSGFVGEFVLALSLIYAPLLPGVERQVSVLLMLAILALISGLGAALYAKAYGMAFLGHGRSGFAKHVHQVNFSTLWPLCILVLACICGGLLAPVFFSASSSTVLSYLHCSDEFAEIIKQVICKIDHNLYVISLFGIIGVFLVLLFCSLRWFILRNRCVANSSVWGCGYQVDDARVQYTSDSFSEPLAKIFKPVMGLKTNLKMGSAVFAGRGFLSITAPDRLRIGILNPLFELIERICNTCKIIQHGKIHIYILYILVTVVLLLIWGLA